MSLPLTLLPGGVHVCGYLGPVGVTGAPALQQFDLTAFPKNIRAEPGFREQLYAWWVAMSPQLANVNPNQNWKILPEEGLPELLEVEVFSSDDNALLHARIEAPHTVKR